MAREPQQVSTVQSGATAAGGHELCQEALTVQLGATVNRIPQQQGADGPARCTAEDARAQEMPVVGNLLKTSQEQPGFSGGIGGVGCGICKESVGPQKVSHETL